MPPAAAAAARRALFFLLFCLPTLGAPLGCCPFVPDFWRGFLNSFTLPSFMAFSRAEGGFAKRVFAPDFDTGFAPGFGFLCRGGGASFHSIGAEDFGLDSDDAVRAGLVAGLSQTRFVELGFGLSS